MLHFWLPHVSWCSRLTTCNHDHFILQPTSPADNFHSAWKIFKPNITDRLSIPGRTSKFLSSCDFTGLNGLLVKLILQGVMNSARYNLHRFQGLVYTEDLDIVLVTETWLHRDGESSELLYSGYSIYRNDR